jgi:hypothetical protein
VIECGSMSRETFNQNRPAILTALQTERMGSSRHGADIYPTSLRRRQRFANRLRHNMFHCNDFRQVRARMMLICKEVPANETG